MKYILCAAALLSAGGLRAADAPADPNQIAFKFYAAEAAKPGNVFFSPYSMYTAFAMTYEGAKGDTASEIASVFGYPAAAGDLRAAAARQKKALAAAARDAEFTQANSFWMQKGYNFLPDYLRALKKFYSGEGKNTDFRGRTEAARKDINSWTAAKTKGRIKELFPADSLDALTRLVLVNAVYFKGAWQTPFKKDMTFEADFTKTGGEKVKVSMMSAPGTRDAEYTENDEFQAVRLAYKGGGLAMLVLLPREGKSPADLEKGLDGAKLDEIRKSLGKEKVRVFLPKFSFSSGFKLNAALAGLGMPTAFTEKADFSGMDGTKSLYIQNAFHKAFVEVSEEGTEAAAATGVAMGLKSMPMGIMTFRANRPFLFFIEDPKSGLLLFMGRMEDPSKK
ncbi:MAG: serpin family protein [Elusimicrobiales bacterium]|nr:serpin family protein [Elusimicrobiales bacterium]